MNSDFKIFDNFISDERQWNIELLNFEAKQSK